MALHLPTYEQCLMYRCCLEARQPSTKIRHEPFSICKCAERWVYITIGYLVVEIRNNVAASPLFHDFPYTLQSFSFQKLYKIKRGR